MALVRPKRGHLRELVPLLNDRSIWRWTLHIPYPYTSAEGNAWFRRATARWSAGEEVVLLIERRSDRRVIGAVGLYHLQVGGSSAELGYWLGRRFRGQGYASEAVALTLRLAFGELGLHRIEARIFPGNRSSVRLIRRSGFRFEGRLRHEVQKEGVWRDSLLFARLAGDPRPRKAA